MYVSRQIFVVNCPFPQKLNTSHDKMTITLETGKKKPLPLSKNLKVCRPTQFDDAFNSISAFL